MLLVIQSWFLVFHLVLNSQCVITVTVLVSGLSINLSLHYYSPGFWSFSQPQNLSLHFVTVLVSGLCFWSFSQPVITFLQSWFLVFQSTCHYTVTVLVSGLSVNLSLHCYCPGFWSFNQPVITLLQSWFLVFQSTCHYTVTVLVSGLSVNLSLHCYSPGFWSFSQPVITLLQSWFLVFVFGLSVNLSLHFYSLCFWSFSQPVITVIFTVLVFGLCFWSFSQSLSLQSQLLVFQSTYNVSLHYNSPDLWSFSHAMPIHSAIPVSGFLTNIHVIEILQS